jgi:hypothetical protein
MKHTVIRNFASNYKAIKMKPKDLNSGWLLLYRYIHGFIPSLSIRTRKAEPTNLTHGLSKS